MKQIMRVLWLALLAGMSNQAFAIEASANGGPQAAQAAVTSMNNTVNASLSALQQQISGTLACNRLRKFYVPGDPKADSSSCVGIGDYQLTMNNTSGVNTTNSSLTATNTNTANTYAGYFQNMTAHGSGLYGYSNGDGYGLFGDAEQAGGVGVRGVGTNQGVYGSSPSSYGVYGYSPNGYGVRAQSDSSWAGVFTGVYGSLGQGTSGYGVQGTSTSNYGGSFSGSGGVLASSTGSWAGNFQGYAGVYGQATNASNWGGEFVAPNYGVYGSGAIYAGYFSGPLCLNGSCISSWPNSGHNFGGIFTWQMFINGMYSQCSQANPWTGGCSCPSGTTTYHWIDTISGNYDISLYSCM